MKPILSLVQDAVTKKASALRVRSGAPVEIRLTEGWGKVASGPLSPVDCQDIVLSLLNDEQRDRLNERGLVEGWLPVRGMPVHYQIATDEQSVSAHLRWHLEMERHLSEWNLPPHLIEKWHRQSGLNLIYGPFLSGKTTLLHLLARKMRELKEDVLFFTDHSEFSSGVEFSVYSSDVLLQAHSGFGHESMIFVDSKKPEILAKAVQMAFAGANVALTVPANSLSSAFLLLKQYCGFADSVYWPMVSECFISSLGLRMIPGIEMGLQPLFELLTDTRETKESLREGTVFRLVEIMAKGGDTSGMRTLNQALLQLLIKRKIELRVGFAESPAPQELDDLLKKVGV